MSIDSVIFTSLKLKKMNKLNLKTGDYHEFQKS
jgi:hypothetical protein